MKKEIKVIFTLTEKGSEDFTKALLKIYEAEQKKKYKKAV